MQANQWDHDEVVAGNQSAAVEVGDMSGQHAGVEEGLLTVHGWEGSGGRAHSHSWGVLWVSHSLEEIQPLEAALGCRGQRKGWPDTACPMLAGW